MADYIKIAKKWSEAGYSVIPVNSEKNPAIPTWTEFQKRPMTPEECEKYFKDCWGIALVMGTQKKLTAIDIDLKNCVVSDFFERYKKSIPKSILKKCYVQSTKNNGWHFVFSSTKVETNTKLASRETSPEEKHTVYLECFQNLRTRGLALKIASDHKSLVIIETRGEGGYIVISPSPGYKAVYGKIDFLDEGQYDELMTISRSFNEYVEISRDFRIEKYRNRDVDPFEEFNKRGDVLKILYEHGWERVDETKKVVRLKRPGKSSPSSALYDKETRVFRNYSTSASLDARAYSPSSIFTILECENDVSEANRKLLEMGFGEKM